jgi:predicted alpha/beta-hydrolase family hydrolase
VTAKASKASKARPTPGALLLAPGAGADRDHHTLVAIEEELAPFPVGRFDFPYRRAGKKGADKAPVAVACVREEVAALVGVTHVRPDRLALGGRSYGGRMCSMAVAEGLPAAGLVLLSYPLHPPGKPDRLRTEHFGMLDVPCLFVSGDRDAFGSPDELETATRAIPGPVTHVWLRGGHDPRNQDAAIAETIRDWLRDLGARGVSRRRA